MQKVKKASPVLRLSIYQTRNWAVDWCTTSWCMAGRPEVMLSSFCVLLFQSRWELFFRFGFSQLIFSEEHWCQDESRTRIRNSTLAQPSVAKWRLTSPWVDTVKIIQTPSPRISSTLPEARGSRKVAQQVFVLGCNPSWSCDKLSTIDSAIGNNWQCKWLQLTNRGSTMICGHKFCLVDCKTALRPTNARRAEYQQLLERSWASRWSRKAPLLLCHMCVVYMCGTRMDCQCFCLHDLVIFYMCLQSLAEGHFKVGTGKVQTCAFQARIADLESILWFGPCVYPLGYRVTDLWEQ